LNRAIKFRAWDPHWKDAPEKENGMSYGNIEYFDDMVAFRFSHGTWNGTEDYILMQYTGLKDKNGKEIYEGDIIKNIDGYVHWGKYEDGEYVYNVYTWVLNKYGTVLSEMVLTYKNVEVIGNIYENPELLGE